MEHDFLHKGIRAVRRITLSPEEKAAVRSRLLARIAATPMREPVSWGMRISDFFSYSYQQGVPAFTFRYAMLTLFVIVLGGGSIAAAAAGTLPGDLLYPVKIHVNEPVQGILAVGTVQEARWEATLAVRRLEEAETLVTEGRLSTTSAESLKQNFTNNVDTFISLTQDPKAPGTSVGELADVRGDFDTALQSHAYILSTIGSDTEDASPDAPSAAASANTVHVEATSTVIIRATHERDQEEKENHFESRTATSTIISPARGESPDEKLPSGPDSNATTAQPIIKPTIQPTVVPTNQEKSETQFDQESKRGESNSD